ncbi:hypothetical protein H257_11676 [Aphanomyces astaci]|uniref:Uncharacterized protein n=1 Tax=Aphanomyces astaci TaxID=112090 RepID=W4G3F4_APHAT|nr:hypothetical protein H257_11676 [Aphanomyces astaci]ETV73549.1 hypothetical protein H257_11676 [Aphanomyces astaci]KAF0752329.1 hypothetical protein AaE_006082 [Aphanomyces astaci]RHY08417.1 hypothetical protein DYB25_004138 [Aphanomyces astaci]RHY15943.1 hypothetical protein DYB36_012576 [Aphanomyces astaci]RHY51103.1 hypothetical protein DYB38_009223 [Aphanomyces astaci]|eukprot:XP_009836975.1 hypothetical protein H257_11676 [Aphanomyces astaci]
MNLFGRKAPAPVRTSPADTAETIRKLREQLDTLEKREAHIEKKMELQLDEAKKKSAAKDKRGAIFCLKRKKMYESEVEKLQGARMTLETQVMTLESTQVNMATFTALRSGANQMKAIHGQMNVDSVDDIMDDIQEEMATADEIGRAISQPLGNALYDEDELEQQLRELDDLAMEEQLAASPVAAPVQARPQTVAQQPAQAMFNLPEVPTHAVSQVKVTGKADADELEELRRLEASMAM